MRVIYTVLANEGQCSFGQTKVEMFDHNGKKHSISAQTLHTSCQHDGEEVLDFGTLQALN